MGDMGDLYNAMKEGSRIKKKKNLERALRKLEEAKVPYESFNCGIHLKVKGFDYWPSTGLIMKNGAHIGRGINKMLELVTQQQNEGTNYGHA